MSSSPSPSTIALNWRVEKARVAGLSRDRAPDDPDLLEARRRMRTGFWIEQVEKLVATAPPLANEQREYIATLLAVPGECAPCPMSARGF